MRSNEEILQEFRLTPRIVLQWILISTIGFFFFAYVFHSVYALFTGRILDDVILIVSEPGEFGSLLRSMGLFLGLTLVIIIPHEFVHGWFMKRYGGTPEYGVGVAYFALPYAYAKSDEEYTRNETLVILLAPLILLSVVGMGFLVLFPTPWLLVPLAANAAGAIGDIWMALILLQYPSNVRITESTDGTGFRIYGKGARSQRSIGRISSNIVHGTVIGFGIVTAVIILGFLASLAFGLETITIGLPNSDIFLFRLDVERGTEASMEFGFPIILAAAVVFGLIYTIVPSIRGNQS